MVINVNHTIYVEKKKKIANKLIECLNKVDLKNNLYIKYVKKTHDVNVMNPKLGTYFLHSLHG